MSKTKVRVIEHTREVFHIQRLVYWCFIIPYWQHVGTHYTKQMAIEEAESWSNFKDDQLVWESK